MSKWKLLTMAFIATLIVGLLATAIISYNTRLDCPACAASGRCQECAGRGSFPRNSR